MLYHQGRAWAAAAQGRLRCRGQAEAQGGSVCWRAGGAGQPGCAELFRAKYGGCWALCCAGRPTSGLTDAPVTLRAAGGGGQGCCCPADRLLLPARVSPRRHGQGCPAAWNAGSPLGWRWVGLAGAQRSVFQLGLCSGGRTHAVQCSAGGPGLLGTRVVPPTLIVCFESLHGPAKAASGLSRVAGAPCLAPITSGTSPTPPQ